MRGLSRARRITILAAALAAWPAGAQVPPPAGGPAVVRFYWGVGCPHCEHAKPFVDGLEAEGIRVERFEVRRDPEGRRRILAEVERLGIGAPGIPLFVVGDRWAMGFTPGDTDVTVRALALAAAGLAPPASAPPPVEAAPEVPLLGRIDPRTVPLLALTAVVGLADGFNPCAFWVLLVLLGLLGRVRSRARVLLLGGAFVAISGVVYFGFMTAWSGLFALAGGAAWVTALLGGTLLVMGLVNLKDAVWFKAGPSLVIPERAKPALYRRMRAVAGAAGWPAALGGVLVLATLANLVELGCTVGLPAMYTRVLAIRAELVPWQRIAWIALYNVFYVVPLGLVVVAWALTLHRYALSERGARALKGASGVLLVVSGVVLLAAGLR